MHGPSLPCSSLRKNDCREFERKGYPMPRTPSYYLFACSGGVPLYSWLPTYFNDKIEGYYLLSGGDSLTSYYPSSSISNYLAAPFTSSSTRHIGTGVRSDTNLLVEYSHNFQLAFQCVGSSVSEHRTDCELGSQLIDSSEIAKTKFLSSKIC